MIYFTLIFKRLLESITTLIVISFLIFSLAELVPGDLAELTAGLEFDNEDKSVEEQIQAYRKQLGLDRNFIVRWFEWLVLAFQGDFGNSYLTERNILNDIGNAFPISIELTFISVLISSLIGIPIGLFSAFKPNGIFDQIRKILLITLSIPTFVIATLFVIYASEYIPSIFTSEFYLFKNNPLLHFKSLILPSITVSLAIMPMIAQMTRTTTVEVLNEPFIITAKSKGSSDFKILYIHTLKASIAPVITLIGLLFGSLVGGLIITESIFNIPGLGRMILNSIFLRDFQVAVAGTWIICGVYVLINLIVDLIYLVLDPRQRL